MLNNREKNVRLIKKKLEQCVKTICIICRIGYADWDLDEHLVSAIKKSPNSKHVTVFKQLDEIKKLIIIAKGQKIPVNPNYVLFQNLHKKQK